MIHTNDKSVVSPSDHQIDLYLDGELTRPESDLFEKQCLENRQFFTRVRRREELRSLLTALLRQ